jgi:hypothetical protein
MAAAATSTTTGSRVTYVFNQFFFDFIRHLKKSEPDDDVKAALKRSYKVVELCEERHLGRLAAALEPQLLQRVVEAEAPLQDEGVRGLELIPGITLERLTRDPARADAILAYLYIFCSLVHVREHADADAAVEQVVKMVRGLQDGRAPPAVTEDVLDDDLASLLHKLSMVSEAPPAPPAAPAPTSPFDVDALVNSKIGSMAREITEELKLDQVDKPEELLNIGNLGSIVSTISNKIQSKLSSGEMKQEDLMAEAMSFLGGAAGGAGGGGLGALLNNPMLKEVMKSMGGGGAAKERLRNLSAKERLRDKLRKRRAQNAE